MSHPVEKLWREVGLPEWFLGNGGTNTKLYEFYDRVIAERDEFKRALELIAAFKGKTIFSIEPEYRDGANAAYEQAADIAINALATTSVPSPESK